MHHPKHMIKCIIGKYFCSMLIVLTGVFFFFYNSLSILYILCIRQIRVSGQTKGAFNLRRLTGKIAGKFGNAYFTLPNSPAGDVLSINGNTSNAGDTVFFKMESVSKCDILLEMRYFGGLFARNAINRCIEPKNVTTSFYR